MKQLATQGTTALKPVPGETNAWTPSNAPDGFLDPAEGRFVLLVNKDLDADLRAILQLPDFDAAWRSLETINPHARAQSEMLYHHEGEWILIWPAIPSPAAIRPGAICPGARVVLAHDFALRHEREGDPRKVFTVEHVRARPQQGPVVSLEGVEGWVEACFLVLASAGGGQ